MNPMNQEELKQEMWRRYVEILLAKHLSKETSPELSERILERYNSLEPKEKRMSERIVLPQSRGEERSQKFLFIPWKWASIAALVVIGLVLGFAYFPGKGNGNQQQAGPIDKPGDKEEKPDQNSDMEDPNVIVGLTGPDINFASFYPPAQALPKAQVRQYELPLDLEKIANAGQERVKRLLQNPGTAELLKKNGFVVSAESVGHDFKKVYKTLVNEGVPLVITPDLVLHLFHIAFDETLRNLEQEVLAWDMLEITKRLLENQIKNYEVERFHGLSIDEEKRLKKALLHNIAYLSVPYKLLGEMAEVGEKLNVQDHRPDSVLSKITIYPEVRERVEAELALIDAHDGFDVSPTFGYKEDYSTYLPRGHYTRSELLKRYFKALSWYGRMSFLFHDIPEQGPISADPPVTPEMADRMTLQATLLAHDIANLRVDYRIKRPDYAIQVAEHSWNSVQDLWQKVYAVSAFFVGTADDLTPGEYFKTLNTSSHPNDPNALVSSKLLKAFKTSLETLPLPRIYGGTAGLIGDVRYGTPSLKRVLQLTQGMRLMGQRYVPDSEAMGRLVFPTVGGPLDGKAGAGAENLTFVETDAGPKRCFPRGLDVMSLLGSERAKDILRELKDDGYQGYQESMQTLEKQWSGISHEQWNSNLYYAWLYTLKPLLKDSQEYEGYPTYMQTEAFEDRSLTAALASWAQLRHDTILYTKQSYAMKGFGGDEQPPRIVGFVEPLPEFYDRMAALCAMMELGLKDLGVASIDSWGIVGGLGRLRKVAQRLARISRDELQGKELEEEDYDYIREIVNTIKYILGVGSVKVQGLRTDIIAEVHTDANSKEVLEVGTGKLRMAAITYFNPEGKLLVGFGPVLSFYEFRQPMSDRLTDEKWQSMLESGRAPNDPGWVKSFTASENFAAGKE